MNFNKNKHKETVKNSMVEEKILHKDTKTFNQKFFSQRRIAWSLVILITLSLIIPNLIENVRYTLMFILGVIVFLIVMMLSIGLHEAGHMVVAKWLKLSVPKFFVGFGNTLWSFKTKKTEYGIKSVPLGGFVSIEDEKQDANSFERVSLSYVAPWKRILVYIAGPIVNIVLGFSIIMSGLLYYPIYSVGTTINSINSCEQVNTICNASSSNLQVNDTLTSINNEKINTAEDIHRILQDNDVQIANITVKRDDQFVDISPIMVEDGKIGIDLTIDEKHLTVSEAVQKIQDITILSLQGIKEIPSKIPALFSTVVGKDRDPESPSSVIALGKNYGDTSAQEVVVDNNGQQYEVSLSDKIRTLVFKTGLFNISLGIINLLPLLPLDGGRIVVAFLDSIKMLFAKIRKNIYKPIGEKFNMILTGSTGIIVLGFMALVILADIVSIFKGQL